LWWCVLQAADARVSVWNSSESMPSTVRYMHIFLLNNSIALMDGIMWETTDEFDNSLGKILQPFSLSLWSIWFTSKRLCVKIGVDMIRYYRPLIGSHICHADWYGCWLLLMTFVVNSATIVVLSALWSFVYFPIRNIFLAYLHIILRFRGGGVPPRRSPWNFQWMSTDGQGT